MPKPVCVPCQRAMTQTGMGIVVEFTRRGASSQLPYQKFSGDQYECPECNTVVITGYGREPVHSHDPAYILLKADITVPETIR